MLNRAIVWIAALLMTIVGVTRGASPDADGITRIPIECEDMQGVKWGPEGFTKEWTAGRWGRDLHQNMIFGGVWSSRMANAVTDASEAPSEVFEDVDVVKAGHYKIWAKYEVPPFFNYPFGIRVQPLGADGKPGAAIFDKTYGLRDSLKHFSFTSKLQKGDLFWNWGMDHDAAEGYEADLPAGKVRVTLYKAKGPAGAPVGARSVDAIFITSLISTLSNGDEQADFNRFPLLDALQKANHLYARFKNNSAQPVVISYNHWNHHAEYYYQIDPAKGAMVRFFGSDGKMLVDEKGEPRKARQGQWTEPVAPGATTPWIDIGPTVTTENSCPFYVQASLPAEPGKPVVGIPLAMDLAMEPAEGKILKSFTMEAGEPQLDVLIQPDLSRKEGVETTAKTVDVFRRVTKILEGYPRVGPIPKKLKLYGGVGVAYWGPPLTATRPDFAATMDYAIALGLNTVPVDPTDVELIDAAAAYYAKKNAAFIPVSAKYHHTQDVELVKKDFADPKVKARLFYVSFGDEIGLPRIDINDQQKLQQFHSFLQARGVKPSELGVESYETIKPMNGYSADIAVQIGVLPKPAEGSAATLPQGEAGKYLKRLYWLSSQFAIEQGIADFAKKTKEMTEFIGPHFKTSANLGGMHPYYWMHQSSFIESFRGKAMTLAWSEDYDYCQPEATRMVIGWQAAYLRAGAKYHDTPMMFYCMPHYPGNSGQHVVQNAVTLWGQGVRDLDFFNSGIDAYGTENYIHSRGGPEETGRALRQVSGMAGNIEDALLPARTRQARVAVLLSEASDVWETGGQGQGVIAPGTKESNISQEERKDIWYCLRNNGYLVDVLTENDVAEGRLKDYQALYVCGHNLDRRAVKPIADWVKDGGRLFLTAGAARRNEYDEPLTEFDGWLGRNAQDPKAVFYGGPMRAKLELLQVPAIDTVSFKLPGDEKAVSFDVFGTREALNAGSGTQVLGTYKDNKPAVVSKVVGEGVVYRTGLLPGQTYVRKGLMPARPMGKGGPEWNFSQWEPLDYDESAAKIILLGVGGVVPEARTNQPGVVANILESKTHTLITLVNLAKLEKGVAKNVEIALPSLRPAKNVTTAMKQKAVVDAGKGQSVVKLDRLDEADVIVIEH